MTPQEMKQLAELLQKVPGIKSIELKDVEGLAQLLRDAPEIGSIEVKGFFGTGVVITRTSAAPAFAPVAMPAPLLAAPPVAAAAESDGREAPRASPLKDIKSPWWDLLQGSRARGGVVCQGGDAGEPGQTVCIIEAMKIMNEIEAEVTGVIREVCVDDAQPVEYGQVLFRVDPNG
jgi:acetyl-CoA carboxylase biotin carboxyl carrier protein